MPKYKENQKKCFSTKFYNHILKKSTVLEDLVPKSSHKLYTIPVCHSSLADLTKCLNTLSMDFAETKDKIYLFLYNTEVETAYMEDKVTLVIKPIKSIILYRPVEPDLQITKTKNKVEIVAKKKDPIKWYTINGPKVKAEYKFKSDSKKEQDFCVEKDDNIVQEDAFTMISRIYDVSNDDVRRAMEKSFIESNGTVLSTDLEDVKNKKVEPKK